MPLLPGQFIVIARNPYLFERKYGFAPTNEVGWTGTLSANEDTIAVWRGLQVRAIDETSTVLFSLEH